MDTIVVVCRHLRVIVLPSTHMLLRLSSRAAASILSVPRIRGACLSVGVICIEKQFLGSFIRASRTERLLLQCLTSDVNCGQPVDLIRRLSVALDCKPYHSKFGAKSQGNRSFLFIQQKVRLATCCRIRH